MEKLKKILLVDDEEVFLEALSEQLKEAGYDVVWAKDGLEGIEKARSEKPDLILLDLLMPRLDGVSALKQLKAAEDTKSIPVVILTNFPNTEKISSALALGAMDYLVKASYTMAELVIKVQSILSK
jgi:DNA-binding response OmpR family regulator